MRLGFVISSLSSGGAERVASILLNAWATEGKNVTLFTFDEAHCSPFYRVHETIRYHALGLQKESSNWLDGLWRNVLRLYCLRRAMIRSEVDVVIAFGDQTNVLVLLAAVGTGLPVIVSERVDPVRHPIGRIWRWLRRGVYPLAAALVVQTQEMKKRFPAMLRRRIYVIPNPVSVPPLGPITQVQSSVKTVIAMGRLVYQKGFDLLLKAYSRVAPQHPEWQLVVWGEGKDRSQIEALRDRLGFTGRVLLPGVTERSFEEMRRADLFVLSSRYEGFPNVLIEAMACGLPVISTDCPSGPREIITNGVNGVLVPNEDVDALAGALHRLMSDEAARLRLGMSARTIGDRFSLKHVLEMWEGLLVSLAKA